MIDGSPVVLATCDLCGEEKEIALVEEGYNIWSIEDPLMEAGWDQVCGQDCCPACVEKRASALVLSVAGMLERLERLDIDD